MRLDTDSEEAARSGRAGVVLVAITIAVVTIVAAASLIAVRLGESGRDPAGQVHGHLGLGVRGLGQMAPTFTLPRLSGDGSIDLADYRGNVLVLNFWRSDCTPCRAEFPLLRDNTQGAQVIGISTDSIPSDAREFVAKERARWPQALDEHLTVAEAYGLRSSLPQTFFVRRDGTLAYHVFGQLDAKILRTGIMEAEKATVNQPLPR